MFVDPPLRNSHLERARARASDGWIAFLAALRRDLLGADFQQRLPPSSPGLSEACLEIDGAGVSVLSLQIGTD